MERKVRKTGWRGWYKTKKARDRAAAIPTHIRNNSAKQQFEVMHLINLMMPRRQLGHEWGKRRPEGRGREGAREGRREASGSCKVCRVCTSSCMWEKLLLPFKIFLLCCLLSHSSEIFVARRRCHQTSLPVSLLCVLECKLCSQERTHTHTEGENLLLYNPIH